VLPKNLISLRELQANLRQVASVLDRTEHLRNGLSAVQADLLDGQSLRLRNVAHELNKWADILGHGAK
jgi:hypothetical protein